MFAGRFFPKTFFAGRFFAPVDDGGGPGPGPGSGIGNYVIYRRVRRH